MIFGTYEFAITYDVYERSDDGHCTFGFFNIVIDDELLIHRGSNWTLNCILSYLKNTIEAIEAHGMQQSILDKDNLYLKAMESRGKSYLVYNAPDFLKQRWELSDDAELLAKVDTFEKEQNEKITRPPFGTEIELYGELENYGWRFFLFGAGEEERLIYSKDAGKTVFEKILPRGTVEKVLRSLPDPNSL